MKKFISFFFILLPVLGFTQQTLVLKNIAVVDVKANRIIRAQTVVIKGNRIQSVEKKATLPAGAMIINGTGKYLIPGLWDMHVHMMLEGRPQYFLPLFVANGITGIRDMGGTFSIERIRRLKDSIQNGYVTGPRIGAMTGKLLDGPKVTMDIAIAVPDTTEARRIVREYKQEGADFIKVYNLLGRNNYLAVMDEAKKLHIPVAGHIPLSMTASEITDLGQVSIEHAAAALTVPAELFISCSGDEALLRDQLEKDRLARLETHAEKEALAVKTYDERKAKILFDKFIKNGTWQCPTIVFNYASLSDDSARMNDQRLKYIPKSVTDGWKALLKQRMAMTGDPSMKETRFKRRLELVQAMHKQGVKFLAGTDVLNPYVFPGFSLHDELEYLVKAGFTPCEALQTATINPALFLKASDSLGTIEKGKIADLVVLDANPLENISNTKRIYAVILNGKIFQRKNLDEMLDKAEQLAAKQ